MLDEYVALHLRDCISPVLKAGLDVKRLFLLEILTSGAVKGLIAVETTATMESVSCVADLFVFLHRGLLCCALDSSVTHDPVIT